MTQYSKTTLKTFFETGDIPAGGDYANLIDSYLNQVETADQSMAGNIIVPELIASRVSAGNINVTGTFSAANFGSMAASSITLTGNLSAAGVYGATGSFTGAVSANSIQASAANFDGKVSAASLNVATDVSAVAGTVYASAMRSTNGYFGGVGIVSAAGTAQATAAILANVINRGQGVADGATTGFAIPANRTGLVQYLTVETNVSANLWPPTGGTINGKAANTVFALAGQTSYVISHLSVSAYGVK